MAASIARKTGKVIGIIVAILVVFILALVAFLTVTEYNPPATQEIEIHGMAGNARARQSVASSPGTRAAAACPNKLTSSWMAAMVAYRLA